MKTLVTVEKPSEAQDIVRALTPVAGQIQLGMGEHFANERHVVTRAASHLVEIQAPEEFDVKRGAWSFANLPVILAALRPEACRQDQDPPQKCGGQAGQAQRRDPNS